MRFTNLRNMVHFIISLCTGHLSCALVPRRRSEVPGTLSAPSAVRAIPPSHRPTVRHARLSVAFRRTCQNWRGYIPPSCHHSSRRMRKSWRARHGRHHVCACTKPSTPCSSFNGAVSGSSRISSGMSKSFRQDHPPPQTIIKLPTSSSV